MPPAKRTARQVTRPSVLSRRFIASGRRGCRDLAGDLDSGEVVAGASRPRARLSPRSSVNRTGSRCRQDRRARPHADPIRCPAAAAHRLQPQAKSGQRVGILDKQVGRRAAVRSRTEVRLHAKMNIRAIEGDEAVAAAIPLAGTETKPAVVGKGSGQVTNREDWRYSRTHDCNLSRPSPRGAGQCLPWTGCGRIPWLGCPSCSADEPVTTELLPLRTVVTPAIEDR
jgi:hypothetical protein